MAGHSEFFEELIRSASEPVPPVPAIRRELEVGIVTLLEVTPWEWQPFSFGKLDRTSSMSLMACCNAGLVSLELQVRAWTKDAMVDCTCVATGFWRQELAIAIGLAVPAWEGQPVSVLLQDQARVRLTVAGQMAQARVMSGQAEQLRVGREALGTKAPANVRVVRISNAAGQVPGMPGVAATVEKANIPAPAEVTVQPQATEDPPTEQGRSRRGRPPASTTDHEERIYHEWQSRRQHHPSITFEEFAKQKGVDAKDVEAIVCRVSKRYKRRRGRNRK